MANISELNLYKLSLEEIEDKWKSLKPREKKSMLMRITNLCFSTIEQIYYREFQEVSVIVPSDEMQAIVNEIVAVH